jgi:NADPH:quinone reductase-like Zn-dependent oxidoreductase
LDFSGHVVAAGPKSGFRPGAEVMGATRLGGTYADYLLIRTGSGDAAVVEKPVGVAHASAALVPFAGRVAYAGLTHKLARDGQEKRLRILIVGASGGVGHLAVQMAKHGLGAEQVVGVCSSRNVAFVKGCGADEVIAYDEVDVPSKLPTLRPEWMGTFDMIFDAAGDDRYWTRLAPALLKRSGWFVSVALPSFRKGRAGEDVSLLGSIPVFARLLWRSLFRRYHMIPGLIGGLPGRDGLQEIASWLADGRLSPHMAEQFPLEQMAAAHLASETGRTVGKISISIA